MRRAVWAGRIWRRGEEELFVKAAPMTQKPAFRLMKLGDVQSVYHLQMPRWLFTDPRYTALSLEAKVAYTFLLNRFQLSRLNGWINDAGEVFIIYTRKSLADEMQVSYRKVIDSMKELSAAGLIWERRCGRGDANQIYLALVEHRSAATAAPPLSQKSMRQLGLRRQRKPAQEVRKRNFFKHSSMAPVRPYSGKKCQNSTCRNPKQALLQVRERHIQKCPFRTPVILIRVILMGFILSQVNLSSASRLP